MTKLIPPPEMLRKLLRYEPATGKLFWRERLVEMFTDGKHTAVHRCAIWNGKWAGKEAFTAVGHGYRVGRMFGRQHLGHRVIWAIVTGAWPVDEIDHINGVRDYNRFENLREASHVENMKNQKTPRNNISGVIGVFWEKARGKWRAQIKVNFRAIHLGVFTDKADAIAARATAEIKYGFHPNHGRAA